MYKHELLVDIMRTALLSYSKTRIKVIQNTNILQNREIKVSRNMRISKSRNKRVAKISCNKVDCPYFGWTMKTNLHQGIEKLIK